MAEKRFIKGLFKDTAHIDQPEGSWRHARNMILNSTDGAVSNEGGTKLAGKLGPAASVSQKYKVVGAIEVNNDKVILFLADVITGTPGNPGTPLSEIGIWEKDIYTPLYNPTPTTTVDLNFKEANPIDGTFKIDSKGDIVVYWTDDLNPPRAFNVDRQLRESTGVGNLYGITSLNSTGILNLFPHSGSIPHISILDTYWESLPFQKSVIEGGGLRTGVYYLALAYVDDDLVATNYLTVSNPVAIVDDYDHTRPTTKKDGAKEGSQTSKSIVWRTSNLNEDYSFLRPVIIRKMGDATEAFKLPLVEVSPDSNGNQTIIFSGLEDSTPASVEEVIIDTVSYSKAKTINQLDGVLYVGNLTGTKDIGYQKYANNIKLTAKTKEITNFDEYYATMDNLESGFGVGAVDWFDGMVRTVDHSKSYRYIPNTTNWRGYMRDEVYAFYIAFILKDGSMTYAYHIPGRSSLTAQQTIDTDDVTENSNLNSLSSSNVIYKDLQKLSTPHAKNFHFFDFSALPNSRNMNYWENSTEKYPTTDNFDIWDSTGNTGNTLKGEKVRHHHFPSNANSSMQTVVEETCDTQDTNPNIIVGSNPIGGPGSPVTFSFDSSTDQTGAGNIKKLLDITTSDKTLPFTELTSGGTLVSINAANLLWDGTTFTATQKLSVSIAVDVAYAFPNGFSMGNVTTTVVKNSSTIVGFNMGSIGLNTSVPPACGSFYDKFKNVSINVSTITLNAGETLTVKSKVGGSVFDLDYIHAHGCSSSTKSKISFKVESPGIINDDWKKDVKVSHTTQALGFTLEDIMIPKHMADKIQGFKIYHAKRGDANKRILGQSVALPMQPEVAKIGMCKAAWDYSKNSNSQQILQTLQDTNIDILRKIPFPTWDPFYPTYDIYNGNSTTMNYHGYKSYSFPDFTLLRSKPSLAGVTHIKPEYKVKNFVWNGASTRRDKKMISKIIEDDGGGNYSTPLKRIEEEWGYESSLNCWGKEIRSALFIGKDYCNYQSYDYSAPSGGTSPFSIPRVISQKAKSYIKGDSIFNAEALGFGGTITNEEGDSSLIFSLKDYHELPALHQHLSGPGKYNAYGKYTDANPFYLVGEPGSNGRDRVSTIDICNLHSFKTDVYKSIDTQELVWTGFEVTGQDLQNFIFDDSGNPISFDYLDFGGNTSTHTADYSVETLQTDVQKDANGNQISSSQYHIFGGDTFICRYGAVSSNTPYDSKMHNHPLKAIHYHIVESSDNINLRHSESDESAYFPGTPAKTVISSLGKYDLNMEDNIKYNNNYSEVNTISPAFPLPFNVSDQSQFPTRAHRSATNDTTSLIDNYRIFLANQFKDLPKNRGDLWKLSSFNNLLYFHMEESLFAAKGKQSMKLGDGSSAYIGDGDLFTQNPDEIIQTEGGFGGTQSQYATLTTRYGYFFVDKNSRKVFLMKDSLAEISNLGMENWFRENMYVTLEEYGLTTECALDNPILGFGFHSVYDPKYKRILLTKRDLAPTNKFKNKYVVIGQGPTTYTTGSIRFNKTKCKYEWFKICIATSFPPPPCSNWTTIEWNDPEYFVDSGWTISYYPELGVWGSFHDYTPYIYFNTSTEFYSLTDRYPRPVVNADSGTVYGNGGIWKHNASRKGILYQDFNTTNINAGTLNYHPFEFELIHNETKGVDTLLSSFNYTAEVFNSSGVNVLEHGFTKFFLYNTFQISGEENLQYLVNTRRVGNNWKVNNFRDMAALAADTTSYYMQGTVTNPNIIGGTNAGTITTSSTQSMFTVDGMNKNINAGYLDLAKSWDKKRKFIDKWVGIRLIYDNISNNLLNLYSTNVVVRKMYR